MWALQRDGRRLQHYKLRLDAARDTADETFSIKTDRTDEIGIMIALSALALGLFALVIWAEGRPSFSKCMLVEPVVARFNCYEELRAQNSQAPAKGAFAPALESSAR